MSVSNDQLIEFVAEHLDGVTTPQAGDHFQLKSQTAGSRLGKLAIYGRIRRHYVMHPVRKYAVWRSK